ncbi:hypothetical protein LCGC14_1031610 [marine sediment metagenome]|uniref:Uncharacterized protein n=1 Tax=marine sediment metagenome TaxID=412755 RepID=A0A0F9NG59_9ZZZZ
MSGEPTLEERVLQFSMLELPGQPRMMHMGTSYLVNDLWTELQRKDEDIRKALEGEADDWDWVKPLLERALKEQP